MGYFPFFVELKGKRGLIVGGGSVALRKAEKLLPYEPVLTVAAPDILPEIRRMPGILCRQEDFSPGLLADMFFVIAATDDTALNHRISALCQEQNIPVNVVDDRAACTFLFPALVKKGDLSIGISTGGDSPSAAIHLKRQINALLPDDFDGLLAYLGSLRGTVRESIPEEARRSSCFSHIFTACLEHGWPLTEHVLQEIIRTAKEENLHDVP